MVNRLLLLGFILYGLFLTGLLTKAGGLLALMAPFLVYLGVGPLYSPDKIRFKISRILSADRVSQDTPVTVNLEITNEGSRLEEVFLEDRVPAGLEPADGAASVLTSLEPGESVRWQYTLNPKRGYYWFQGVKARASDPTGLIVKQEFLPTEGRLMVMPYTVRPKRIAIRPRRTKVYSGFIPARTGGPGVEFFGVREFQPGDPPQMINWKSTARHPRAFFTNEFEQERIADVGLILDARQRSYSRVKEGSLFEFAVLAAAALAESFLSDGNRVGMLVYGRVVDWTFPGYGKVQKEHILRALTRAGPGKSEVFDKLENIPTRLFPSHSQLIFISPLIKQDCETLFRLRARGYQVLVVSPDPIAFEEKELQSHPDFETGKRIIILERELMLRELRRAGIHVLNWEVNIPIHQAINSTLGMRPYWYH
ncbi:MAG: DUF58 domain-containing protein [Deltaproteobacteria bacterium]|nr:DUF58 domain-containing protein [Deltaproteobacteria bacterium]